MPFSDSLLGIQSRFRTVKLGENLYAHLLRLHPAKHQFFPLDVLLYYDVFNKDSDGEPTSLMQDNPDYVFVGAKQRLPGFFIPQQLKRVLHGSCRKPHAKQALPGWEKVDQLSCGAGLVEQNINNLSERPASLFLTGDQIYADDVAMPVLAMLIDQGKVLTGWDERIPIDANGGAVTPATSKLHGRMQQLHLDKYGITSGAGDNHLLIFGEFAAMYLAAWGGEVSLPKKSKVFSRIHISSTGTYDREKKRADTFFATRQEIQRLFANMPVYMIFDDHEVTDDWNINREWESEVYGNPFGKRMVANALAAYWAFQAWGNDPDKYDDTFIDTISSHLNKRQARSAEADAFDAQMLDRQQVDRWSYSLATDPFTVVLDTRMQREAGSNGPAGASVLMNSKARAWLTQTLEQQRHTTGDDFPLLLISASPVFGFARMEDMQDIASGLGLSVAAVDKESWKEGFNLLEAALMQSACGIRAVTVLSGDVHYSFSVKDVFRSVDFSRLVDVAQLTSSPISNKPAGGFIGKALLAVNDGEYPEMIRPEESKKHVVTSLNQLGLVCFDADGWTEKHVLVARKRRLGEPEGVLTYHFTQR